MVSLEILHNTPFFQDFEPDQLRAVSQSADLRMLAKSAFLFRAGDQAEAMYILISGELAVTLCEARGQSLQLAVIEPGSYLGEMGLSQRAPRSANISATMDSVLLQIQRNQFDKLLQQEPAFALRVLADISMKLLEANRRLERCVTMSVKERLWLVLNRMAKSKRLDPAPKVTDLAVQIDASREMTSRTLNELIREQRVKKVSSLVWEIDCGEFRHHGRDRLRKVSIWPLTSQLNVS